MICEKCKQNKATIHLTEIIKNVKSELHLCENCAKDIGLNSKLSNFSLSIPDFLSFLDVETDTEKSIINDENSKICLACGTSISELHRISKPGCPDCYSYLKEDINRYLKENIKNRKYKGKVPTNFTSIKFTGSDENKVKENIIDYSKLEDIDSLNMFLKQAVSEERFEDAAEIRDKIQQIHNGIQ